MRRCKDSSADSIVAVGSGVITDTTRYVASLLKSEFVSVPTAASMDGYASNLAVMEFGGMKTSFPVAPPVAIFADPRTIAAAPLDMTRAGLGDLFGKASAHVDWLASHELYGERFCPVVETPRDRRPLSMPPRTPRTSCGGLWTRFPGFSAGWSSQGSRWR